MGVPAIPAGSGTPHQNSAISRPFVMCQAARRLTANGSTAKYIKNCVAYSFHGVINWCGLYYATCFA